MSTSSGYAPTATTGKDSHDRFGCGHSDDAEAATPDAGDRITSELTKLLPGLGADVILVGRYVWSDQTVHRSPLGEDGQGCKGASNQFAPAPGTTAAVQIMPAGATTFTSSQARMLTVAPGGP